MIDGNSLWNHRHGKNKLFFSFFFFNSDLSSRRNRSLFFDIGYKSSSVDSSSPVEENHIVIRGEIVRRSVVCIEVSKISRSIVIVDRSINRSLRSLTTIEEFYQRWLKSNLPIVRVILRLAFSFG